MRLLAGELYVECGYKFSRFVKFSKGKKYFFLSEGSWNELCDQLSNIVESHANRRDMMYEFQHTEKAVKTETFRSHRMTTFMEKFWKDGKQHTKYLSMTHEEWSALRREWRGINRFLNKSVIVYGNQFSDWSLFPPTDQQNHEDGAADEEIKKQLITPMCLGTYRVWVFRFLLVEGIRNLARSKCLGCRTQKHIDDSSHKDGSSGYGCRSSWETLVEALFEMVYGKIISISTAISIVNEYMGWAVPSERPRKNVNYNENDYDVIDEKKIEQKQNDCIAHDDGDNAAAPTETEMMQSATSDDRAAKATDWRGSSFENEEFTLDEARKLSRGINHFVQYGYHLCCPGCESLYPMYTDMLRVVFQLNSVFK